MNSSVALSSINDQRALIAVDLGAESCRVSLLRWQNGQPTIALVHRHPNAPVMLNCELRWDLQQITQQVDIGLRKCAEIAVEGVRSIAIDGWAVDYVRLQETGEPIADPFCYRDERSVAAQAAVFKLIPPQRLRAITGIGMSRINTLYQLFADKEPQRDKPWLNLPEYLLHRLGGRAVAEYTNATHTQLVDAEQRAWSEEIFAATGLAFEAAPPLVPAGTVVGALRGAGLNLRALEGTTLITPACHDTASAIASIPDPADDWIYISSGTWSLVGTLLHKPHLIDDAHADGFNNMGAIGGRICFHKGVNAMWIVRQCMEAWAPSIDWSLPELMQAAELLPPPAGLLDVDEPDLLLPGEMPTRINRQLRQRGLVTYAEGAESAPAMVNLVLHSLAAKYAEIVAQLKQITGKHFKRIYIVGGGSRNYLLNRLAAVATQLEVCCGAVESSTVGNFAVQLAALESGEATTEAVAHWAQQLSAAADTGTRPVVFACDLQALTPAQRQRQAKVLTPVLKSAWLRTREQPDGYAFDFPANPAMQQTLEEWAGNERLCCPFLDFEIEVGGASSEMVLRIIGPEGAKPFIRAEFSAMLD